MRKSILGSISAKHPDSDPLWRWVCLNTPHSVPSNQGWLVGTSATLGENGLPGHCWSRDKHGLSSTCSDCVFAPRHILVASALIELQALKYQSCIYGSCQPLYGPYIDCVNHIWNIDYSKTFQRDIKAWFHCVDIPGPSNLSLVLRILFTISQIDNMVSFDQGCAGWEKGETPCVCLKPFSNGLNIDLFYQCVCI